MIPYSDLLQDMMRLALTTAALTIPAISVAYFLVSHEEEESKRMSKVIGYGTIAAIVLIMCSIFSFGVLSFGYEEQPAAFAISGIMFVVGLVLLLYILIVLAGFKREIPMIKPKPAPAAP